MHRTLKYSTRLGLIGVLLVLASATGPVKAAEVAADFSDRATAYCELSGLRADVPDDWFSVPVEGMPPGMVGCQMMRTDETEALVGILRLSSGETGELAPGAESRNRQLAIELAVLEAMGIEPGDPLWSRDQVPLGGLGSAEFSNAQAVGLAATVRESGLPQEIHILVFHAPSTQYTLLLITPTKAAEPRVYSRNLRDFGILLQGLTKITDDQD